MTYYKYIISSVVAVLILGGAFSSLAPVGNSLEAGLSIKLKFGNRHHYFRDDYYYHRRYDNRSYIYLRERDGRIRVYFYNNRFHPYYRYHYYRHPRNDWYYDDWRYRRRHW